MRRHDHLTVSDLAEFPAVLPLDPHRLLALLGQTGVIQAEHTLLCVTCSARHHEGDAARIEGGRVPRAIGHELLQLLQRRVGQHLGHALDVLARQLRRQPQQILHAVMDTAATGKYRRELRDEALQLRALNRAYGQLHRSPPLPSLPEITPK